MDHISKEQRSKNMRAIRSKNTKPELIVRKLIHGMGHRYRLHRADLPGQPDLVFSSRRKIIFVHGCFWHFHGCKRGKMPKSRLEYWQPKLEGNRERDLKHIEDLYRLGWKSLVVWECETEDLDRLERIFHEYLS
jgi:DNA mismatch endonuclease, patch repair protein